MNMKKTILYLSVSLMLIYILPGCNKNDDATTTTPLTGSWVEGADFEGVTRNNAVAFTVGNIGYVGTGFDGTNRKSDFWSFDGSTWTQLASVPGVAREKAVGFCVGDTGYIGTGYDGVNLLSDFYAYDVQTNNWITKPDFGGSARSGAVGFGIGNIGFVGTGFDGNYKNDLYKYSPSISTWEKVATLTKKTSEAVSFVISDKAYICSGLNNGTYLNEVMEYNPALDTCILKTALSNDAGDIRRTGAVGFALNGTGYISSGTYGSVITSSTWSFSPSSNAWTQVNDMSGGSRSDAVAFIAQNRAFVATGRNNNARFDDVWEFKP
jgi:N-acetylneuraminic acid mutarotase